MEWREGRKEREGGKDRWREKWETGIKKRVGGKDRGKRRKKNEKGKEKKEKIGIE